MDLVQKAEEKRTPKAKKRVNAARFHDQTRTLEKTLGNDNQDKMRKYTDSRGASSMSSEERKVYQQKKKER